MQLAIEEIERRFQEVMHRHSPRKHLHIHVMASRVRLEMKGAFTDVKDRIKVPTGWFLLACPLGFPPPLPCSTPLVALAEFPFYRNYPLWSTVVVG